MEIGDRVTWIEFVKGARRDKCARVATGIIAARDDRTNHIRFQVQILWMSGSLPHDVRESVWLSEADLRKGRAEEWQHRVKTTPFELAKRQHQRYVDKMRRDFIRSLKRYLSEAA